MSAAWASALAIAVAASSVNRASRASVSAGSGARLDTTLTRPHSRPSTVTGTPTTARAPSSRARSATGPVASPKSSIRAGWPVWNTSDPVLRQPRPNRVPTGTVAPALAQVPTIVYPPSASYRPMPVRSASSSRPASAVTAANTSSGGAARATSVATRRSAACSWANSRSSVRACAFAIAVAASSVNPASRTSVSVGSGSQRVATSMTPHGLPATLIGTPTDARMPTPRAMSPTAPLVSA